MTSAGSFESVMPTVGMVGSDGAMEIVVNG